MKKWISVAGCGLFVLLALLPLGMLLSGLFSYEFELRGASAVAALTAALAVAAMVISLFVNEPEENFRISILYALLAPLSMINAAVFSFRYGSHLVLAYQTVYIVCCCCLSVKHGKPKALKVTGLVLYGLLLIPVVLLLMMMFFLYDFGKNTVVASIDSPSGAYYAEVVDVDQGALGGDTVVYAYERKGFDAILFRVSKKPQMVYMGEWREYVGMEIYWKDDHNLVIHSHTYEIE